MMDLGRAARTWALRRRSAVFASAASSTVAASMPGAAATLRARFGESGCVCSTWLQLGRAQ
jgi:hypothetical protein